MGLCVWIQNTLTALRLPVYSKRTLHLSSGGWYLTLRLCLDTKNLSNTTVVIWFISFSLLSIFSHVSNQSVHSTNQPGWSAMCCISSSPIFSVSVSAVHHLSPPNTTLSCNTHAYETHTAHTTGCRYSMLLVLYHIYTCIWSVCVYVFVRAKHSVFNMRFMILLTVTKLT